MKCPVSLPSGTTPSSTIAIGAATAFIAVAAAVGLSADRPALSYANWTLRGALHSDAPPPLAMPLQGHPKPV